jgi:hypothetical protein
MKPPGRQAGFDPHQIRTTVTTWRRPSSVTRPRGSALPPAGAITTSRSNRAHRARSGVRRYLLRPEAASPGGRQRRRGAPFVVRRSVVPSKEHIVSSSRAARATAPARTFLFLESFEASTPRRLCAGRRANGSSPGREAWDATRFSRTRQRIPERGGAFDLRTCRPAVTAQGRFRLRRTSSQDV